MLWVNVTSCHVVFFRERDRYLQKLALGKEGMAIAHSSPVVIIEQYTHCMKALTWSLLNWNFLIWLRGTCEVWSKCLCNSIEIMILRIIILLYVMYLTITIKWFLLGDYRLQCRQSAGLKVANHPLKGDTRDNHYDI